MAESATRRQRSLKRPEAINAFAADEAAQPQDLNAAVAGTEPEPTRALRASGQVLFVAGSKT